MAATDSRIDNLARVALVEPETPHADVLRAARNAGYAPATITLAEIEQEIARLQKIARPTVEQKLAIELRRAQLRGGCHVGSPAEQHRVQLDAQRLLGALEPRDEAEAVPEPLPAASVAPAQPQQAQQPADKLPEQLRWTALNPDPKAEWRK